jgi:hypothetical protein
MSSNVQASQEIPNGINLLEIALCNRLAIASNSPTHKKGYFIIGQSASTRTAVDRMAAVNALGQ